jgi:AcrR family transcriptional regulator
MEKTLEYPTMRVKITSRDRILNACRKLFVKDKISYPKISITDICETAKVGRKTFYRYFASKEDAYYQLIENDVRGFEKIVDEIIALEVSPIEKIKLLNRQFLKTYSEDFTTDFIEEFRYHCSPEIWEFNAKKEAEVISKFRTVIQEGIDDGSLRNDINPDIVLYVINATAYSLSNKSFSSEQAYSSSETMDQVYKIILNGIINVHQE